MIDPLYSAVAVTPAADLAAGRPAPWLYGEGELECWRLAVLRERVQAAELKVGYPGKFHTASGCASFRCQANLGPATGPTIHLRAVGAVTAAIDEREVYRGPATDTPHTVVLPAGCSGAHSLRVDLQSPQGEPPGLLIASGAFSTAQTGWQWSVDGRDWSAPVPFPPTVSGVPPHRVELPAVTLKPEHRDGELIDFGRELFGQVVFSCPGRPELQVGESVAEALNTLPEAVEQSTSLVQTSAGRWTSRQPLAFRYLRVTGGAAGDVTCRARFHPTRYRGAFACSDDTLTRIWMHSAYTLRLCLHDFLIDGVKRDRLPWAGDLAMSLMANAYSFADAEIVRRSLTALGRAGIAAQDINAIIDYSLWWIIAEDFYQLYFADHDHLRRVWPRLRDGLDRLKARCDLTGLLQPGPQTWLFIDWVNVEKRTALQILWWWAQVYGASLAERLQETVTAAEWRGRATALAEILYARAWDEGAGAWRSHPDQPSELSRHANLLAVIAGLTGRDQRGAVRQVLLNPELPAVGTPYMQGFECMALGRLGATGPALSQLRAVWGGMLARGATTFWEAYDPAQQDDNAYAFYDRPFGKSLCHAWSAGPAALLPAMVTGIRPVADGWRRFTVAPDLAGLAWACAAVPTPHGDIQVEVDSRQVTVAVPAGTTLDLRQRSYPGPAHIAEPWDPGQPARITTG